MTDCCDPLPRPLQGDTSPLNDTMASTSAASGSAQMTLDQLVQRVQSASTSHTERESALTPHLGFHLVDSLADFLVAPRFGWKRSSAALEKVWQGCLVFVVDWSGAERSCDGDSSVRFFSFERCDHDNLTGRSTRRRKS
jgi:hypothetical protein